jgi:hypothetical protein
MTWFCATYLIFYLGLGRLAMIGINRLLSSASAGYEVHVQGAPLISLLMHAAILALGTMGPLILQGFLGIREYTLLQVTNPFWTIEALFRRGTFTDALSSIAPVSLAAAILFMLNLRMATPTIIAAREATPDRVKADDAELGRPANTNAL